MSCHKRSDIIVQIFIIDDYMLIIIGHEISDQRCGLVRFTKDLLRPGDFFKAFLHVVPFLGKSIDLIVEVGYFSAFCGSSGDDPEILWLNAFNE